MKFKDLEEIRGSISIKTINGNEYCYLKYREEEKVKTVYLVKPGSDAVAEAEEKLEQYRLSTKNKLRKRGKRYEKGHTCDKYAYGTSVHFSPGLYILLQRFL